MRCWSILPLHLYGLPILSLHLYGLSSCRHSSGPPTLPLRLSSLPTHNVLNLNIYFIYIQFVSPPVRPTHRAAPTIRRARLAAPPAFEHTQPFVAIISTAPRCSLTVISPITYLSLLSHCLALRIHSYIHTCRRNRSYHRQLNLVGTLTAESKQCIPLLPHTASH